MNTVELFSGTGSFSNTAKEKGHNIFRVEINNSQEAELHKDILELQREELPENIGVLWASPLCTTFSVASLRHYWNNGRPKNAKTWHGMNMVMKTLQLIQEIKKDSPQLIWFIENPRGMLRKQKFMESLKRNTITYCQYGFKVMKPTDIWTNYEEWIPKKACSPRASCHESAKRGHNRGIQNIPPAIRSKIPPKLFEEIFSYINKEHGIKKQNKLREYR